jgi:hypothetical protein
MPSSTRRDFLQRAACCLAGGAGVYPALLRNARLQGATVAAPGRTHFPPRANNLIFVFLTGGFSHLDTFDYKPRLRGDHGKLVRAFGLRDDEGGRQPLLGSPFRFDQHGQSGLWVSEIFPHLARVADELCVLHGLHTDIVEHFQAVLAMHTGSATVPLPSLGAWLSYGLGTRNPNLPDYVVLAEHLPYAGSQVFDSNFLSPVHQGVRIQPGPEPIPNLRSPARSVSLQEFEQLMLRDINEQHAHARSEDQNLRARMHTFDVAGGLMREAPEAFHLARESAATLSLYGVPSGDKQSFGAQCLLARRLVERGVRVVELIDTGSHDNWDAHGNMSDHRGKAARVDRPLAGLLRDLRRTGLLDETLVAVCTEFGRTPWTDNATSLGRNHYARAFSALLAGAGVRGGFSYGQTDDYGATIVADPCHVHDYHATILHIMGIDHTRLTYRYAGRDFRLTDVYGNVARAILA